MQILNLGVTRRSRTITETLLCSPDARPADNNASNDVDRTNEETMTGGAPDEQPAFAGSRDVDPESVSPMDELRSEVIEGDVARIRASGFALLFQTGRSVVVEDLAAHSGLPVARVKETLEKVRASGQIELDENDQMVGIAGMTVTPGRHEIDVAGVKRWTWCALDAVGILGAFGASGTIRSTDAHTGTSIEIEFVDGTPQTETHLFILGGYSKSTNVRRDWCQQVNFFSSADTAEVWAKAKGLVGDVVAIGEISKDSAAMWQPVVENSASEGWLSAAQRETE